MNRNDYYFMRAFLLTFLMLFGSAVGAQTDTISYSFFIAGHTYGKPGVNNIGLHPPFKQKFGYIKSRSEIKFGVLTGDIVSPNPQAHDWDEVDADIDLLGLPVYFAVGNHDMENRPLYESRYGDTYYYFIFHNDLFLILDPNIDHWNISGEQLEFMKNVVNENYKTIDNIFVLFHQFLWWQKDNIYSEIKPNSFAGRADTINFWTEVEPFFHRLPNKVFFLAGDMGAAWWSNDFMYDKFDNISFVCSGMGEGIGDNFVVLNISSQKQVTYDLICLNDTVFNCFGKITDYMISPLPGTDVLQNVVVYPNPTGDFFKLRLDYSYINIDIAIYNTNGQVVLNRRTIIPDEPVNISSLEKGVYIIIISKDSFQNRVKLVIY